MTDRIEKFVRTFDGHAVDAAVVSRPTDVQYLSGFTGEDGMLLVRPDDAFLLVDFRYAERAEREVSGVTVEEFKGNPFDTLSGLTETVTRLGFDASFVTHTAHGKLSKIPTVELVPLENPVSPLRAVKDNDELRRIRKSIGIAERTFLDITTTIVPGISEKDIADEIEYRLRKHGASCGAFPAIVGSGTNSSLPHHTVSDRVIGAGDAVLIDMGAVHDGYASDLTRMVFLGEPSEEHRTVYQAVIEAQARGAAAAVEGARGVDVDAAARAYLKEAGYGDLFGHGLGHGVGLEVHESPVLSPRSTDTLKEGMIITLEPGVYRRGWGGIRIEDMAVITGNGCEILTSLPRDIESARAG